MHIDEMTIKQALQKGERVTLDEVELALPVPNKENKNANDRVNDSRNDRVIDGIGENGSEIQLSERQKDILSWVNVDGDTTATKMAKLFGISKRTIDREISFLRKNGYIKKETKDNRSPWLVVKKY